MTAAYDWSKFVDRLRNALTACERLGGESGVLIVGPPASNKEVDEVESALGAKIPFAFRQVLQTFSRKVDFSWRLPDQPKPPFAALFSGSLKWDLDALMQMENVRQEWIDTVFSNPDDAYDLVWHDKLAFHSVPNGDMLAISLADQDQPVVYLSHEGGESHGYALGRDFIDYLDRLSRLGCPGSEDWQWMPFTTSPKSYLDPECNNARLWLEWFGM